MVENTNFEEKRAIFPVKKRCWPIFSRIYNNISLTPRSLLKTQCFEKKANFPMKKVFWPNSSRINEHDKCQGTSYKGPQGVLTITVEVTRSFLLHLWGCWKTQFFEIKRQPAQWRKDFGLLFSHYWVWHTPRDNL